MNPPPRLRVSGAVSMSACDLQLLCDVVDPTQPAVVGPIVTTREGAACQREADPNGFCSFPEQYFSQPSLSHCKRSQSPD